MNDLDSLRLRSSMSWRLGVVAGAATAVLAAAGCGGVGHGPTALAVDCRGNGSDPRCSSEMNQPNRNTIGTGPALGLTGENDVGWCAVDTARHQVVIPAAYPADMNGMLLGVDLTTGNRTLLSGSWQDPATGTISHGSGPAIDTPAAVQLAADGSYVVLVQSGATDPARFVRVDPTTGVRSMLFDSTSHMSSPMDPCFDLQAALDTFVLGRDGTIYVAPSNGTRVVAVSGNQCRYVVCTDSACMPKVGRGPDLSDQRLFNLQTGPDGALWATNSTSTLVRINTMSGAYTVVSSSDQMVGTGDSLSFQHLAFVDGVAYTVNEPDMAGPGIISSVNLSNGARTDSNAVGFFDRGPSTCWTAVPGAHTIVTTSFGGPAIGFYEPSSGNAAILSN